MSGNNMFPVNMYPCPLRILRDILGMFEFGLRREVSVNCKDRVSLRNLFAGIFFKSFQSWNQFSLFVPLFEIRTLIL